MKTDSNLNFLRSKILTIQTALCTFHSPEFADSSSIVRINQVDDEGNLYFNLIDDGLRFKYMEKESFGITLFFYKKNLAYHLNINALAQANEDMFSSNGILCIKAKILSADYKEKSRVMQSHSMNIFSSIRQRLGRITASLFV